MKNLSLLLLVALISFSSCKKCETCYKYEFLSSTPVGEETSQIRSFFDPSPLEVKEFCGRELKEIRHFKEEIMYDSYRNEYLVSFWICEPNN